MIENICLPILSRFRRRSGALDLGEMERTTGQNIQRLRIHAPGPLALARQLSGGNQQKVLFAKWLETKPKVFVMDEPTIGVDVGAKEEIRKIIDEIASAGVGVVLVTTELDELVLLCDRVLVMFRGAIIGELSGEASRTASAFCTPRPAEKFRRLRRDTAFRSPKPEPLAGASRIFASLKRSYSLIQALGVLAILIVVMQIANDRFLSPVNVGNLLGQMTMMLIVAAGMTIVMIAGEFDVSVGSVVGLSAAVAGWIMVRSIPAPSAADHRWWVIALGLDRAALRRADAWPLRRLHRHQGENSLVHRDAWNVDDRPEPHPRRNSRSANSRHSADRPVCSGRAGGCKFRCRSLSPTFSAPARSRPVRLVPDPEHRLDRRDRLRRRWFVLERTAFGKRVYAVGSNRTVAILSGIRADRVKIQCLMIVGFTASLAGVVSVSRLGAVSPNTGEGLEFEVIAAVVIGGTGLYGGQGKILRTIIGVIIIALTRNFLNLARIAIFWQGFATGAIILAAVLLEALQRRISERQ